MPVGAMDPFIAGGGNAAVEALLKDQADSISRLSGNQNVVITAKMRELAVRKIENRGEIALKNRNNKDITPAGTKRTRPLGQGVTVYEVWDGTKWREISYRDYQKPNGGLLGNLGADYKQQELDAFKKAGSPVPNDKGGGGGGGNVEPEPVNKPIETLETSVAASKWESNNKNLRYPYERMESTQDYLQFSIIEYQRKGLTGGPVGTGRANQGTGVSEKSLDTNILGTVTLPVPSQIGDNNGANFGSGNLNFLQEQGIGIADAAIEGDVQRAKTQAQNMLNSLVSESGRGLAKSFFANQAVGAFGGNIDLNQLLARDRGIIINPNMELLFTGPKLRTFTFAFKFTPRFSKEAEEIRQIIRVFKKHSSPKSGKDRKFLKTPDIFQIRYLGEGGQNHQFLNRFKLCALTNMTVNYTGDGVYATYDDGTPVSSIMTLTFNELTPVYNEDYDGSVGGVGY